VEGGGRGGGGLVHPDPLGRPPDAAGAAEVEVADAVAAGPGDPERVPGAPLEPVSRRHPRRVHLVPVRVAEREAHRIRGRARGRAARLDLHSVRARAPRDAAADLFQRFCRRGGGAREGPGRRQLRRGELQAREDGEREQRPAAAERWSCAGGHGCWIEAVGLARPDWTSGEGGGWTGGFFCSCSPGFLLFV
jgi:hypothetical protein